MNLNALALLATVVAGMLAIPFLTPSFETKLTPTGAMMLGINESQFEESQIPGKEETLYSPEKFKKRIQTPYGNYEIEIKGSEVYQKLSNAEKEITSTISNNFEQWLLRKREYILNITKTPEREISLFLSSDGWIKTEKIAGNLSETWYGFNNSLLQEKYEEAKQILEEGINLMHRISSEIIGTPSRIVLINEFMPDPPGSDQEGEWIELYNPSSESINLEGWFLTDSAEDHILQITENNTNTGSTIIPSEGFLVVYRNNDNDFSLNNNGDTVKLFDSESRLVDSYSYDIYPGENRSIGRCPDGSNSWQVFEEATPGCENSC